MWRMSLNSCLNHHHLLLPLLLLLLLLLHFSLSRVTFFLLPLSFLPIRLPAQRKKRKSSPFLLRSTCAPLYPVIFLSVRNLSHFFFQTPKNQFFSRTCDLWHNWISSPFPPPPPPRYKSVNSTNVRVRRNCITTRRGKKGISQKDEGTTPKFAW